MPIKYMILQTIFGVKIMNIVAHNLTAMNAQRQFGIVNKKQAKTAEKLSSGYKINRSADDAAGLAMSEKMRRQIRGLNQAAENIQEGIGYVQVADGALNEVHDILHRMNELAVKAANGTHQDIDREYIDQEVQQLKSELDRIFDTTAFNERLIWEPNGVRRQIGTELKQAVNSTTNYSSVEVNNQNYEVLGYSNYKTIADDQGISVAWTGYDGLYYETARVDWATLEADDYSFELSDYFDNPANANNANLIKNGNPVFTKRISFDVEESATIDDIITCLNDRTMYSSVSTSMAVRFEDSTGGSKTNTAISVSSAQLNYSAAYASKANSANGHDFDVADDIFLEPKGGVGTANLESYPQVNSVPEAKASTDGWTFKFDMEGIGEVTASSYQISYGPTNGDLDDDDEHTWWEWEYYYTNGNNKVYYKDPIERTITGGTLGDVMSTLTGTDDTKPGLLVDTNGGKADAGGYIDIDFNLTAKNNFNFGGTSDNAVGSFTIRIQVDPSDEEADVLQKIEDALNDTTVLDFYTGSGGYDSASIGSFSARTNKIDVPIWGGACDFFVQAGPEVGSRLTLTYDSLSTLELDLNDKDVLTINNSNKLIESLKDAVQVVSEQRSLFGAYQNRLEHAYNNNKNVEENTQAAESQIRDTDMAQMMVQYSNHNILLQAGQAMMAQANQSNQGVLTLLQQ